MRTTLAQALEDSARQDDLAARAILGSIIEKMLAVTEGKGWAK